MLNTYGEIYVREERRRDLIRPADMVQLSKTTQRSGMAFITIFLLFMMTGCQPPVIKASPPI